MTTSAQRTSPPPREALLLIDLQQAVRAQYPGADAAVARAVVAADDARRNGILVLAVHTAFRTGAPEINPTNQVFGPVLEHAALQPGDTARDLVGDVADRADAVLVKTRVSAFCGTELDLILRANRVTRLAIAGISTTGCVLSSVRAAADLDYELTVLRDACTDLDAALEDVVMDQILGWQADIVTVAEWTAR